MHLTANPKKWLRRLHAWLGAALIALFLFFAITGFALNHRATLKLPLLDKGESTVILKLESAPIDVDQLLSRLASEYNFPPEQLKIKKESARQVIWSEQTLTQPEQWIISANQPSRSLRAEYWVGNLEAEIKLGKPNLMLHLARLHMAIGTGPTWVIVADLAVAGLLFLCLSGLWLWGRLHGTKQLLIGLFGGGLSLALVIGWMAS